MIEEPVTVEAVDLGVVDGLQTWEVRDAETGEVIGWNQSAPVDR